MGYRGAKTGPGGRQLAFGGRIMGRIGSCAPRAAFIGESGPRNAARRTAAALAACA